jgi:hypothetical protein
MITGASRIALRTSLLPQWLGFFGLAAGVVLAVGAFAFPGVVVYVLLLWVLAVSVALATASPPRTSRRERPPAVA